MSTVSVRKKRKEKKKEKNYDDPVAETGKVESVTLGPVTHRLSCLRRLPPGSIVFYIQKVGSKKRPIGMQILTCLNFWSVANFWSSGAPSKGVKNVEYGRWKARRNGESFRR